MLAHRKQGPVLPTLVVNVSPDPTPEKVRKRRSSRSAGLAAAKEAVPTTLWFRPGDDQHTLHDWARCIQSVMQSVVTTPMSPITPASPTFMNPFLPRSREPSDSFQRPASGNPNARSTLSHKTSNQTYSSQERNRPLTYSESPSLRSRRSDLSHAGSTNPPHTGFKTPGHGFAMPHPADLPSPATTVGEYQGEFIEGWTSAQGRASTLSSPGRGRESIGSAPQPHPIPMTKSNSPPGPRETILDRAFQLRCIPGSEHEVAGEEKLTSLARFDALMREADEKRKTEPEAPTPGLKSAWDLDDDDSDSDSEPGGADQDGGAAHERDLDDDDAVYIPATAKRALHFIASRHSPAPAEVTRTPTSATYNAETLKTLNSGYYSHLRPHTGYAKHRPAIAQRTHSQPQLAAAATAPSGNHHSTLDVPLSPSSAETSSYRTAATVAEKRLSTSSIKRLSFTEFTKRLSSTSSLLLVPTNASAGSQGSRTSGDTDPQQQQQHGATALLMRSPNPRGVPLPPPPPPEREWEKRCGWRGSVGVFGAEGGFL